MAKVSSSLVLLALTTLIFQESFGIKRKQVGFLSVRNKYSISVKDGVVFTDQSSPTLYSLIRIRMYPHEENGVKSQKFTLEGIASGQMICMKKNGLVTTEDMKVKKRMNKTNMKETQVARVKNNSKERIVPSDDCYFRSYPFNSTFAFKTATSVYSVVHSNSTIGQFLAFNRHGGVKRFRSSLKRVKNFGVTIKFMPPKKDFTEYIKYTKFNRCNGKPAETPFNTRMKECIQHRKNATNIDHLQTSNILFRAIEKCRKESCRSRSNMRQDSLQRNHRRRPASKSPNNVPIQIKNKQKNSQLRLKSPRI